MNNFEHQLFCGLFQAINCLCSLSVMELMWGLEIQMQYLGPGENSELTNDDRFRMSKGMEFLLNYHNFDVKENMMVSLQYVSPWSAFCFIAHCILQAFSFHTDQSILLQCCFWNFAFTCYFCISNVPLLPICRLLNVLLRWQASCMSVIVVWTNMISPCAMQLRTWRKYLTLTLKIGIYWNLPPRSSWYVTLKKQFQLPGR